MLSHPNLIGIFCGKFVITQIACAMQVKGKIKGHVWEKSPFM